MLPHILRHSEVVTEVALILGRRLNDHGQNLDLTLVEAGALLHDIAKSMCLDTKENHAISGGDLLGDLGYSAVADIVRQHICLDREVVQSDVITEAAVVNYADKRVKHEEIVNIEERFRDVKERYLGKFPQFADRFKEVFLETQRLEVKIFSLIDISPQDINGLLDKC